MPNALQTVQYPAESDMFQLVLHSVESGTIIYEFSWRRIFHQVIYRIRGLHPTNFRLFEYINAKDRFQYLLTHLSDTDLTQTGSLLYMICQMPTTEIVENAELKITLNADSYYSKKTYTTNVTVFLFQTDDNLWVIIVFRLNTKSGNMEYWTHRPALGNEIKQFRKDKTLNINSFTLV